MAAQFAQHAQAQLQEALHNHCVAAQDHSGGPECAAKHAHALSTDASNALGLSVRRLAINHLVDARWRGLCHALFGSLHTGLGHLRQVLQQSRRGAGGPLREALLR
ncbi:hypothetical protein ABPG77_009372 [Micractinium sp. CCAP 211/92]